MANQIMREGIKAKDSLHIACTIEAQSKYFITTDRKMPKKSIDGIAIMNQIDFVRSMENEE
jgi:hypothetical protein